MAGKYDSPGTLVGIFAALLIVPLFFLGWSGEEERERVTVQTGQIQRVAVQNLGFGLYPLSLELGKSSSRFCMPAWSKTSFTRGEKSMGYIYHFSPPGDLSRMSQVKLLPGAPDAAFPDSKCGSIEALTRLTLTIEVKPDTS